MKRIFISLLATLTWAGCAQEKTHSPHPDELSASIRTTRTATTTGGDCPEGTRQIVRGVLECASEYYHSNVTGTEARRWLPSPELGDQRTADCLVWYRCVKTTHPTGPSTCQSQQATATVLDDPTATYCSTYESEPYETELHFENGTVTLTEAEAMGRTREQQNALLQQKCEMKLAATPNAEMTAEMQCTAKELPLYWFGGPANDFASITCCLPACADNADCPEFEACLPPYNGSTNNFCRRRTGNGCDPANGNADCPETQVCAANNRCAGGGCCTPSLIFFAD